MVLKERHQLTGEYKRRLHEKEQKIFHLIKDELSKISTIDKNLNLELMAFSIIAMCHWAGYWFNEKGKLRREEAINQIIKIVFDGIQNADIHLVPNISRKNIIFRNAEQQNLQRRGQRYSLRNLNQKGEKQCEN